MRRLRHAIARKSLFHVFAFIYDPLIIYTKKFYPRSNHISQTLLNVLFHETFLTQKTNLPDI